MLCNINLKCYLLKIASHCCQCYLLKTAGQHYYPEMLSTEYCSMYVVMLSTEDSNLNSVVHILPWLIKLESNFDQIGMRSKPSGNTALQRRCVLCPIHSSLYLTESCITKWWMLCNMHLKIQNKIQAPLGLLPVPMCLHDSKQHTSYYLILFCSLTPHPCRDRSLPQLYFLRAHVWTLLKLNFMV